MQARIQQVLSKKVENELHTFRTKEELELLLQNIRKEINALPKLTKKQFASLPEQQRQEYIRVLERLASQCAVITNSSKLSNNQTAHFTLMALQMVQEREREKKRNKLEQVRKHVMQHDKYFVSTHRLLHKLKRSKVQPVHKRELIDIMSKSNLISKYSTNNNYNKWISDMVVVLKDLQTCNIHPYAIEECLLYGTYKSFRC